jgi:L-ascorbate metabolism protein UlaG (beta-lactamase superfamily)
MSALRTAEHLASFARFVARREQRERTDLAAMRDMAMTGVPLARGLELEWLGTAGYRLSFEGQTLLIDPYLTRVPLSSVFKREATHADRALHDRFLPPAALNVVGILVGHTHFDHAIDVPELARSFDTNAFGSSSLVQLMALHAMRERAVEVEAHRVYELGPFTVRFIPSLHSKLLLGYKVPFDGALTCDHLDKLSPSAYRCGPVYAI